MIQALIFDFDGLILDTEGSIYQSWQEFYQEHGCQLTMEQWATTVGTADLIFDPLADIARQTGRPLSPDDIDRRLRREAELIAAQPVMPGVRAYLEDAHRLGLKVGLASSSPCSWVVEHLTRLELLAYFESIIASDDVLRTKPDPALYRMALIGLGVEGSEAIAFEDSPYGIQAAQAAGIFCVAVPNTLTLFLDTGHADLTLDTLDALSLESLLQLLEYNH